MKFLHLGDLHLGRSLGDFDLIDDQRFILRQILEIVQAKNADAVLIAGDVYDKAVPSEAAVNLLNDFLCRLAERHVRVFLISGNHDSDDRLNFGSRLFETSGICISAVYDGTLHKYAVRDAYGEVAVWLLPFVKASQVRHFFPDETITTYDDAVRVILRNAPIDDGARNVIVAHQFVAGKTDDPSLGGSESIGTQSVGTVEKIGFDCFDRFDYAALGHIHAPQRVGRDAVRYAGSPLKYSLNEAHSEKSVPFVTLTEKGIVSVELIALHPLRDLRRLRGTLRELTDVQNVRAQDDFIYATLTDEDAIPEAMGILRGIYPNTVKVDFDNSRTRALERTDISAAAGQKTFDELIGEFYRMVYGCEISGDETDVLRAAAREAGVLYEAD